MDKTVEGAVEHLAERVCSVYVGGDRAHRSVIGGLGTSTAICRSERTKEEPDNTPESDRDIIENTERKHPGSMDNAVAQAWFWGDDAV